MENRDYKEINLDNETGQMTVISDLYLQYSEEIKNFQVYDDDVWVASYPKAGAKKPIKDRFPFLEASALIDRKKIYKELNIPFLESDVTSVEFAKQAKRPRFLKTHLPFSLLPEQLQNGTKSPKMICVIRNPKDSSVSFYHHGTLLMRWRASLEKFVKVFMSERSKKISFLFSCITYFPSTGTVGKYKEELSAETITKLNEWIKKNVSGTELENEDIFQV
ncbi:hypothetical protein ILUMI_16884 [Ignelater luminosus]|uniref:Sulfotransferase domain-containing protein n=1 Tax=Ignelater luminosus TaxID=2038154 RepID=A0A8K0G7T1_IGNLU|nr:hypothetical protein ILUMI_16884 [Ignelater luminosus]